MSRALVILCGLAVVIFAPSPSGGAGVPSEVLDRPITGMASSRPGWTSVEYPDAYRTRGPRLAEALVAYLGSAHADDGEPYFHGITRREARLMLTAQLAADLEVQDAVPFLVGEMERLLPDDDTHVGSCLIATLVDLTNLEDGGRYHRRWFDESVQAKALAHLKAWMRESSTRDGRRPGGDLADPGSP